MEILRESDVVMIATGASRSRPGPVTTRCSPSDHRRIARCDVGEQLRDRIAGQVAPALVALDLVEDHRRGHREALRDAVDHELELVPTSTVVALVADHQRGPPELRACLANPNIHRAQGNPQARRALRRPQAGLPREDLAPRSLRG